MTEKLSVGDIVFNEWCGLDNHSAFMVVVQINSKTINCISPTYKPGQIRHFYRDRNLRLRKIGKFDITAFLNVRDNWKDTVK